MPTNFILWNFWNFFISTEEGKVNNFSDLSSETLTISFGKYYSFPYSNIEWMELIAAVVGEMYKIVFTAKLVKLFSDNYSVEM